MPPSNLEEQLTKYLTDVHSIEVQALAQMRSAPEIAGDAEISIAFSEHLHETEEHERRVNERLSALGSEPASVKDAAGAVTGKAFVPFARSQPDTPGKLVAHAWEERSAADRVHSLFPNALEAALNEQEVGAR